MSDTFDYVSMRATADRLLAKFGAAATIRRVAHTGTDYDPTETTTDYATKAVVLNPKRWYPSLEGTNNAVVRVDRLAYVSMGPLLAAGVSEITPLDLFLFGGKEYTVIDPKPLIPAGSPLIYTLWIKI